MQVCFFAENANELPKVTALWTYISEHQGGEFIKNNADGGFTMTNEDGEVVATMTISPRL